MDIISKHLFSRPRRFGVAPNLVHVGYEEKDSKGVVKNHFSTFNFSLILEGGGFYELRGVRYEIKAPCIILQWPGELMHYGPHESWIELYLIYPIECEKKFSDMGIHQLGEWTYPLRMGPAFEETKARFIKGLEEDLPSDRLDLMALEMLLLGRGVADGPSANPPHSLVRGALIWMRSHLEGDFNLERFCRTHHLSTSSFRRLWGESQYEPPHATFTQMKLARAAQILTETSLRVSEVARTLGYDDPLHFSRRFKNRFGLSPRQYRKRYQPSPL